MSKGKGRDDNDRLRDGDLPRDPFEGATAVATKAQRKRKPFRPPSSEDSNAKRTVSSTLVEIAEAEIELFHDADNNPFATVAREGHHETHALRSRVFKSWLSSRYYAIEEKAPGLRPYREHEERALPRPRRPVMAGDRGHERRVALRSLGTGQVSSAEGPPAAPSTGSRGVGLGAPPVREPSR